MSLLLRRPASALRLSSFIGAAVCGLLLSIAGLPSVVQATTIITFDPDGAGPDAAVSMGAIDFKQGNSLFQSIGPVINNGAVPVATTTTIYMQASVSALVDGFGSTINVPGLSGHNYQLTMVMGFPATATLFPGGIDSYALAGGPSFFKLYFSPGNPADDLAGTGFATNGPTPAHAILSGVLTSASGVFSASPGGGALDQFGADNYPGVTTLSSVGGGHYNVAIAGADPNFFVNPPPADLQFVLANASNIDPFLQANPSALFYNDGVGLFAPNLGAVNGLGSDFQVQADANASFVAVPEPSSLILAGMGLAAIAAFARRRET